MNLARWKSEGGRGCRPQRDTCNDVIKFGFKLENTQYEDGVCVCVCVCVCVFREEFCPVIEPEY